MGPNSAMNRIYCDQAPNDATWAAADRGRSAGRGVRPAPEEANAPLFDKSTYFRVRHSPTIDGLTNLTLVRSEGNRSLQAMLPCRGKVLIVVPVVKCLYAASCVLWLRRVS